MSAGQACLWGLLGVVLIEVHALWSAVTAEGTARWPWRDEHDDPRTGGYMIAVACRMTMGVGLNAVYAAAHQIDGPLAAVTMGIAAPLIIKQMAVRQEQAPQTGGVAQPAAPAPPAAPAAPAPAAPAAPAANSNGAGPPVVEARQPAGGVDAH